MYITEAAMRTLVDIPDEDLAQIKKLTQEQGISRAEYVRRAVRASLEANPPNRPKVDIDRYFGLWAKRRPGEVLEDGQVYQDRLRSEWDREWD